MLFRASVLFFLVIFLSGCEVVFLPANVGFSALVSGQVREKMKPEVLVVGKDGTIGVKVKTNYYRYGFFSVIYDGYCSDPDYEIREVPLNYHSPRERYILLNRPFIEYRLKDEKPDKNGVYHIEFVCPGQPDYIDFLTGDDKRVAPYEDLTVIPRRFWGKSPSIDDLPDSMSPTVEFPLSKQVDFVHQGQPIRLSFDALEVESDRLVWRYHTYPILAWYYGPITAVAAIRSTLSLPGKVIGRFSTEEKAS